MTDLNDRPAQRGQGVSGDFRREMALVPETSIAGRSLVTIIAIMTFLAALMAGFAALVTQVSLDWRASVGQEMTMQIRPRAGRSLDQDVATAIAAARGLPGVTDAVAYDQKESERLLEPWLGAGLDLKELPVPRLVALKLKSGGGIDSAAFRKVVVEKVPTASLDDHRLWLARLSSMANAVIAVAIALFALALVALGLAIVFATRGAMAGNREIVDVLHFVGAEDRYIARQFQRHFFRMGLKGAAIGGCLTVATFLLGSLLARPWVSEEASDQMQALFGAFALGPAGYFAIAAASLAIAFLTGSISRAIVFRRLRGFE